MDEHIYDKQWFPHPAGFLQKMYQQSKLNKTSILYHFKWRICNFIYLYSSVLLWKFSWRGANKVRVQHWIVQLNSDHSVSVTQTRYQCFNWPFSLRFLCLLAGNGFDQTSLSFWISALTNYGEILESPSYFGHAIKLLLNFAKDEILDKYLFLMLYYWLMKGFSSVFLVFANPAKSSRCNMTSKKEVEKNITDPTCQSF